MRIRKVTIIFFSALLLVGLSCQRQSPASPEPTSQSSNQQAVSAAVQDTDGDGLSDSDEQTWGTDVSRQDSDGDGYSDGVEVVGGYNPLGAGKLADSTTPSSVVAQGTPATSFSIEGMASGGEPALHFDVVIADDPSSFKFHVTGYGAWDIAHRGTTLCFKKVEYRRTYCIGDKYFPPPWLPVASTTQRAQLSDGEEIATGAIPANALAAFLGPIELAVQMIRSDQGLKSGEVLSFGSVVVGKVDKVQRVSSDFALSTPWFDLIGLGREAFARYQLGIPPLPEEVGDDDSYIDEMFKDPQFRISLDTYTRISH